jgi:hypothetical protein
MSQQHGDGGAPPPAADLQQLRAGLLRTVEDAERRLENLCIEQALLLELRAQLPLVTLPSPPRPSAVHSGGATTSSTFAASGAVGAAWDEEQAKRRVIDALQARAAARRAADASGQRVSFLSGDDDDISSRYPHSSSSSATPASEDEVLAIGSSAFHRSKGVCRVVFRGPTVRGPGVWYGVVFGTPRGDSDGSVVLPQLRVPPGGRRRNEYFSCAPDHGLFCRRDALTADGPVNYVRSLHRFRLTTITVICVAAPDVRGSARASAGK